MRRRTALTVRRTAFGVLAAMAATSLAATLQPVASAAPAGGGTAVTPAASQAGAHPAFSPLSTPGKAQATKKGHGLLVCPPPANYDPDTTAP